MTRDEFIGNVTDWDNHRVLLWYALEATKGPVLELGTGDGSTPFLHTYCEHRQRKLFSFDTDEKWLSKWDDYHRSWHKFYHIINNWHIVKDICPKPSVILVDHAPGERRIVDVARFEDIEGILVCHDTQPKPTAANYHFELVFTNFKYRVDLTAPMNDSSRPPHHRTWASAISNHYDVTQWKGFYTSKDEYQIK